MSDSRSLKDKYPLPYPGASRASKEIRQQAQEAGETARDKRAQMHTILSHTRQLIQETEGTIQHTKARREYETEQGILSPATVPPAGVDIVLIEDNPADAALFDYVLHECALPCRLTVLSRRSDMEAFFYEATTATHLSIPRLIIADCLIPGMAVEDVVAAIRMVPAYQRIPVILFSTLPEEEGQRLSAECGATMFVHKPSELQAFVEVVTTMVRRWSGTGGGSDVTPASPQ